MMRLPRLLFVLLLLTLAPRFAHATCSFANGTNWSRVIFNTPSQIMVPSNAAVGTVLWSSPMVAQSAETDVYCNSYTSGGIVNYLGAQPSGGATTFPTNIPGLSIQLARGSAGSYLIASPSDYLTQGTTQFNLSTSLQLVVTGTIPPGSTLYAGQLAHWDFGNLTSVIVFQTANATTFTAPACTVAVDPTVVILPAITTGSLPGKGATAGDTPFGIQLSCNSSGSLQITLDSTNPVKVSAGILSTATGSGAATGVGVQITKDGNPVALRQAISVNATQGSFSIPFGARYYRTGNTLNAGTVSATATYTLTYP